MKTSQKTTEHGMARLQDPWPNKGTAFTEVERDTLGLRSLPPLANTREVSAHIAVSVAEVAFQRGLKTCLIWCMRMSITRRTRRQYDQVPRSAAA